VQHTVVKFLKAALFNPASTGELVVSAAVAAFAFVLTVNAVAAAMHMSMAQSSRSTAALVIGAAVNLAVLAFIDIQFSPSDLILIAVATVVTLVVVVPCMCFLLKGSYPAALLSLAVGGVAVVLSALLVHAAFGAISGGTKSVGKGLDHKRSVEVAVEGE